MRKDKGTWSNTHTHTHTHKHTLTRAHSFSSSEFTTGGPLTQQQHKSSKAHTHTHTGRVHSSTLKEYSRVFSHVCGSAQHVLVECHPYEETHKKCPFSHISSTSVNNHILVIYWSYTGHILTLVIYWQKFSWQMSLANMTVKCTAMMSNWLESSHSLWFCDKHCFDVQQFDRRHHN